MKFKNEKKLKPPFNFKLPSLRCQNDIHNSPHLSISRNKSKEYVITNLQKDEEKEKKISIK